MKLTFGLLLTAGALWAQGGTVNVQARVEGTKTPLPNVELRLRRSTTPETSWSAQTGADGKAQFEKLVAGRYFLQWYLEGYIDAKTVGSRNLEIKDGGRSEEVTIELAPSTKVEGTVLDENGRPMEGVTVYTSGNRATSDREGHYRLSNMSAETQIEFHVPLELRKKTLRRDEESGEILGYSAVQFYPGVVDRAAATTVQLTGGMVLHGFDVRLRRVRLADFSGRTVTRAGGEALASASVELTSGDADRADETLKVRAVDSDGRFRFEMIPPGTYALAVYRGVSETRLPYRVPVDIGAHGLLDKEFVVPNFPAIQGVLRAKDGVPWQGDVQLIIWTDQSGARPRELAIPPGGDFALQDIPPGQWQIALSSTVVRLPDKHKLTITFARFGLTDPLTGPITVVESGNPPLEIELSTDTGQIFGTVNGARGGYVLVARAGARRIFFPMARALVREDGSFLTDELAPGFYEVHSESAFVRAEVKSGETTRVRIEPK